MPVEFWFRFNKIQWNSSDYWR